MASNRNRLANTKNQYQGSWKKVLCVCSAGLLRSPTAALVLSRPPFNFNTRAAGLSKEYALIVVDDVLIEWADEIVVMSDDQAADIRAMTDKPIRCLNIEDSYDYRDLTLEVLIRDRYNNPMNWE